MQVGLICDRVLMQLRKNESYDISDFKADFGREFDGILELLIMIDLVERDGDVVSITQLGRTLLNVPLFDKSTVLEHFPGVSKVIKDKLTVVIPTLNEEEAIGSVIGELSNEGYHNILVVDGYSTDNTVKVAGLNGARIIFQHGKGKTGALKTAINSVETPYIVLMDGDSTYDPKDIWKLVNHAEEYDQIIGARSRENISRLHRLGNWIITKAFNILMGTSLSDVCSGMYLLKTKTAQELDLYTTGFTLEVELAAQTAEKDSVTEVPINYRPRMGRRKLSTWRNGFQILGAILNLARLYNPVLFFSALTSLFFIPATIILTWVAVEALFYGMWHSGWVLMSVMLILLASQGLTIATISVMLKRMEKRITRKLKSNQGLSNHVS